MQLMDDVQQEAILHLAERLEKAADLGHHPGVIGAKFASWIGTILLNECRDALRRLHAGREPPAAAEDDEAAAASWDRRREQLTALRVAIDELPEPQATVLRLFLAGDRIAEIAKELRLTYKQTYAIFTSGIDQLRNDWS